jgi:23S rRNA (uracil1939-C5)-methyltransferase
MNPIEAATVAVRIERVVAGGSGLGRYEGRVVLVPMTAPGDFVEARLSANGPRAELIQVIEHGPNRVQPACQHYGECGGCDLMHLSYEAQLTAKGDLVLDAMRRIYGDLELPFLDVVSNPKPFGSRSRATWRPAMDGSAGYVRRASHEVFQVAHCPVLDPALEAARAEIRTTNQVRGLTNGRDISMAKDGLPAAEIEFKVAGERLWTSADAFFQACTSLLVQFVRHVVDLAGTGKPRIVYELYAGIGLFTLPLARRAAGVETVESGSVAVRYARMNVAAAGLTNVDVHESTAERWLARQQRRRPDVILVDPPRVGLSTAVTRGLIALGADRLVYVSCDPATFARDARVFVDAGFRIESWAAFDLFPQTHHVELVASFVRTDR